MEKVLFICTGNAALSQMAEALFRDLCGGCFESHSAGIDPAPIPPFVTNVMSEIGLDLSLQQSKRVNDYARSDEEFAYVVSLCGETHPDFPGNAKRLDWNFPDPATFSGTEENRLQRAREVRDALKLMLATWCAEVC